MTQLPKLLIQRTQFTALIRLLQVPTLLLIIGAAVSSPAYAQFDMGSLGGMGGMGGMGGLGGMAGGIGGMAGGMGGMAGGLGAGMNQLGSMGGMGGGMSSAQTLNFGGASAGTATPFGSTGINAVLGGMNGTGQAGQMGGMGGAANNPLTNTALGAATLNRTMGGMMGGRGRGMQNNQQNDERKVRATLKLGMTMPQVANTVRSQEVSSRLTRIPTVAAETVRVEVLGRQAVIRGRTATADDGRLIERLLALEPGIDSVRNELEYESGEPNLTLAAEKAAAQQAANAADESGAVVPAVEPEIVPKP